MNCAQTGCSPANDPTDELPSIARGLFRGLVVRDRMSYDPSLTLSVRRVAPDPGGAVDSLIAPETIVVQSDQSHPPPAPDPGTGRPLFRSLEDRLAFRQAQGMLAGLTGCGRLSAARSLRTTAEQLDVDVAALARRFLSGVQEASQEPARALLLRIAVEALLPARAANGRRLVGADVAGTDEPGVQDGRAELAEDRFLVPGPRGVSVRGELDVATVPLLDAATGSVDLAVVRTSSIGEAFVLDLADLTFLDSARLRVLDALAARVRDGGSTLRVVPPRSPGLGRVLDFAVSLRWLPPAFEVNRAREKHPYDDDGAGSPWRTPTPGGPARLAELEALYHSLTNVCWSLARRMLGDDAEAEAVVLAAFVETWRYAAPGAPLPGQVGGLLLQRTHREAAARLREQRTGPDLPPSPDQRTDRTVLGAHRPRVSRGPAYAADGLSRLPRDEARALRLAFWGGLTVQQIATATGTPLADVRASMLAGVRSLSQARDDQR